MTLRFSCPKCSTKIAVADQYAGKKGECPKCRAKLIVPDGRSAKATQGQVASPVGTQQQGLDPVADPPSQPSPPIPATASRADSLRAGASNQWYYSTAGKRIGPVSEEALVGMIQTGQVSHRTMVWRSGMGGWVPVASVRELSWVWRGPGTGPRLATGKKPGIALVLSLLIVGLGQFYNGDTKKGLVMLLLAIGAGVISFGLGWFGVAIWSAIDAYNVAKGYSEMWQPL